MLKVDQKYRALCATPSDINEHLPTLYEYALQCDHVTEMGVRWITSTWALLAAQPIKLISYDIQNPSVFGASISEVEEAAKEAGVDFTFIEKDVLTVDIEPTEMLFLDTLHVWEQVEAELKRHSDKVSKYIVFHDTTSYETRGELPDRRGIWGAIDEFLTGNKEWKLRERFTNNNGLTIIQRIK